MTKQTGQSRSLNVTSEPKLKSNISIKSNRSSSFSFPTGYTAKETITNSNGASFVRGTKDITNYGSPRVIRQDSFIAKFSATGRKLWEKIFSTRSDASTLINDIEIYRNRVIGVGYNQSSRYDTTHGVPSESMLFVDLMSADGSSRESNLSKAVKSAQFRTKANSLEISGNSMHITANSVSSYQPNGTPLFNPSQTVPPKWDFFYNMRSETLESAKGY